MMQVIEYEALIQELRSGPIPQPKVRTLYTSFFKSLCRLKPHR